MRLIVDVSRNLFAHLDEFVGVMCRVTNRVQYDSVHRQRAVVEGAPPFGATLFLGVDLIVRRISA